MDHSQVPLYRALKKHSSRSPLSFHVPGHKYGKVFPSIENEDFQGILKIDATEITGLDDLHAPEGVIMEAEDLLADLYKVQKSFFLVNGSTVGNLAMIMAVCKENDIVLVQRNCHKSIMNAIKLARAHPIFLEPEYDEDWGVAAGVTIATISKALDQYPNANALILTYPNYYGMTYDLKSIIKVSHEKDVPVLVDEAHGAHFTIGGNFPTSATTLGADIVIQSAHKTLPAMTMGSYLHFNSKRVSITEISEYLHMFQSSSPSYPIMASLDLARAYLATFSGEDYDSLMREIRSFKKEVEHLDGLKVNTYKEGMLDPLKLTIQSTSGLTGYELQNQFEGVGIFTEMADPQNVILVLPLLKKTQQNFFAEALERMKKVSFGLKGTNMEREAIRTSKKPISELALSYKQMEGLSVTYIELEESDGRISAETIIPYPPGIPLILTGERLTSSVISNMKRLMSYGSRFQGGESLEQGKIRVFSQSS
ncbi:MULTISPECIES: aminotransferase class I/II-fold pyridoxal phosphate-dependent enzyme [unclassified Bacillus (in: firmicutes)]|uniref:aminotransferase class I/II-fold pyridoxal phosphate-dependent enzyme n=1 Tax=unclassified Bacillus (in: firmicutes) TaxID=185979 RepID=UPI0008E3970A|nr:MULTISPECIES: aminotransferase class I/II-fold pyridoxal phosphate-dependent enzyme [unclassified Bacillus (in: firmicutes)]SFB22524.1 Arginine/lysine/ornithine decarboxylase [Bacillus sp. UNCCL13]SFQ91232.1 Arginine/lysine/ornithine decarboxylase [Bacillus sp. cl95]